MQQQAQQPQKPINFLHVQGRIVWELKNGVFQGLPVMDKNTGLQKVNKQGQLRFEFGFGLAIPKNSPDAMTLINAIQAEGYNYYQNGWPPNASKKYVDGDVDVDHMGLPFKDRDGYAGHYVFTLKSERAIQFYAMQNGTQVKITSGIKNGDYVGMIVAVSGHPANSQTQAKAGVYINPHGCIFLREGAPIAKREGAGTDVGAMFQQFQGQAQPLNNAMPAFNQGQQQQQVTQPNTSVLPGHLQQNNGQQQFNNNGGQQFNGGQANPNQQFNGANNANPGAFPTNNVNATFAQGQGQSTGNNGQPQPFQQPAGFNPFGNNNGQ